MADKSHSGDAHKRFIDQDPHLQIKIKKIAIAEKKNIMAGVALDIQKITETQLMRLEVRLECLARELKEMEEALVEAVRDLPLEVKAIAATEVKVNVTTEPIKKK